MSDIIKQLRSTLLDRNNFPRMSCEKWLPVKLAKEAADEIERLRAALVLARRAMIVSVTGISDGLTVHDIRQWIEMADAALEPAPGRKTG